MTNDNLGSIRCNMLAPLELRKEHEDLKNCILEYPCLLEIFDNIKLGRPMKAGVIVSFQNTLDLFIENLFIPLLVKHNIVSADSEAPSGYSSLVESVALDSSQVDETEWVKMVQKGVHQIGESINPKDCTENTLFAYIEGEDDIKTVTDFMNTQRTILKDGLHREHKRGPNSRKYRIALAFKIEKDQD